MAPDRDDIQLNETSRCGASQYVQDVAIPNWKKLKTGIKGCVKQTTAVMHIYANSVTGNDAYAGTLAKPVQTLQAAFDLIPTHVRHNVAIHLQGTFTLQADPRWAYALGGSFVRYSEPGVYIVVDGGPNVAVNAGPFSATIHSDTELGFAAAGWIDDQWFAHMVQILTGPCTGQTRLITGNTADRVTFKVPLTEDAGVCTFRFVHPATEINFSGPGSDLQFGLIGGGNIFAQRLYFTGDGAPRLCVVGCAGQAAVQLAQCICENPGSFFNFTIEAAAGIGGADGNWVNPDTFENYYDDPTQARVGVGCIAPCIALAFSSEGVYWLGTSALQMVVAGGITGQIALYATRAQMVLLNSVQGMELHPFAYPDSGVEIRPDPASWFNFYPALMVYDCHFIELGNAVKIESLFSHGIETMDGTILFSGDVTGTSGGAGVYAHAGSKTLLRTGVIPTITGAIGDFTTDSAGIWTATWAAIQAAGAVPTIDRGVAGDWTTLAQVWDPLF